MTMDLTTAMNLASSVPSGTEPYFAACALCQLRHLDPHAYVTGTPLLNWQMIIVEQVLGATIVDCMKA